MTAAEGQLIVNGQLRDSARTDGDYPPIVDRVSRLLAAVGERLLPGDRLADGRGVGRVSGSVREPRSDNQPSAAHNQELRQRSAPAMPRSHRC